MKKLIQSNFSIFLCSRKQEGEVFFGQGGPADAGKDLPKPLFLLLQDQHALLDAGGGDEAEDGEALLLPDAVGAGEGLLLRGEVPPRKDPR